MGMEKSVLISFWMISSDQDLKVMEDLFEKGHYTWALFVGHLVIEKLLKAYYVENIDIHPPLIHNLLRIAEKSKLKLSEEQKDFLVTVTTFNIQARYNDVKQEFYHKCTKKFTEIWINKIKDFRTWIKNQHLKS
jgi:HEPN domain-containing protein